MVQQPESSRLGSYDLINWILRDFEIQARGSETQSFFQIYNELKDSMGHPENKRKLEMWVMQNEEDEDLWIVQLLLTILLINCANITFDCDMRKRQMLPILSH